LKEAAQDATLYRSRIEVLDVKRKVFADLGRFTRRRHSGTNSSAIVSSLIADATQRPDKVVNMHFFNPALVMKLVEVSRTHVSTRTRNYMELSEKLEKCRFS